MTQLAYNLSNRLCYVQNHPKNPARIKKGLVQIYGDQLKAVYLFGSYARGEERPPDSDIDVMIVLNGEFNYRKAQKRSIDFVASLCLEHDIVITRKFASDKEYSESQMPYMINVCKDAVAI